MQALRATGALRTFNEAGVLAAADVHVAQRVCALADEHDELVVLAVAFAVRAPRLGHVFVDLSTIAETASVESEEAVDLSVLPWPEPAGWVARVAVSVLVGGPLQLVDSWLYLDRYWREERQVADDLLARAERLKVIAGGPGTGKTTMVARLVGELSEQDPRPLIALAAPTGKAAARLAEAVHAETGLYELEASTLHRLLGWRPDSNSRFRHHRGNRLPHDVVIVDETSMVGLSMMARLVEAVRPDAQLVLVGDPAQLTSIEAGAVLGDIVAGANGVVTLEHVYRHGGAIAALAAAVRVGDADRALEILASGAEDVTWLADPGDTAVIRDEAVAAARAVTDAAAAGDARTAIDSLGAFRVLCAHRRGDHGAATWVARIEGWLGEELQAGGRWYVGRPLLVTENDYSLRLFNGDTGVVVAAGEDRVAAAFERHDDVVTFSPSRLAAVDTVYAMTIHKSQGSQFKTAAVVLPDADSPILTRELLYTAVTRAQERLVLAGSEGAVRLAVERPIARASGLRRWLA